MLEYVPVAAFLLLFQVFRTRLSGLRLAFLASASVWAAFAVVATEALSSLHLIGRASLGAVWIASCAALAWLLSRGRSRPAPLRRLALAEWRSMDPWIRAVAFVSTLLAGMLGVTALCCAPNTYDVMAYHMPRVMVWLQSHSVGFFPTHMANMNFMPPGNEYLQLQFSVLGQDDFLANGTQWFAWLGTLAAVSLALKLLGAEQRGQWMGAFLAATLPQGVLVASGAKNDVTLTFWLVTAFVAALAFGREATRPNAALLALSAALALLTKSLAWFLLPSFGLALVFIYPRSTWLALFRQTGIIMALTVLVAGPFWLRSFREYGSITGPRVGHRDMPFGYQCELFTPAGVAANVVRNLAVQFNIGPQRLHRAVDEGFRAVVSGLGEDPDDPRSLWPGTRFHLQPFYWGEGGISNTAHLLLYFALALAAISGCRKPEARLAAGLWAAVAVGFLLFSGYLRWQPWHTRLHLPLFAFAAIPAGWMLGRLPAKWSAGPLLLALGGVALYAATQNTLRPWTGAYSIFDVSRNETLFAERRADGPSYQAAVSAIANSGCRKVGLIGGSSHFYYPAFVLLGVPAGDTEVRFLRREGGALEPRVFAPCAVFCVDCAGMEEHTALFRRLGFSGQAFAGHMVWLKPAGAAPAPAQ